MTSGQSPGNAPESDEINLEDIEALLEAEDPEFSQSMNEVRSVEVDKTVEIEASTYDDITDEDDPQGQIESDDMSRWTRWRLRVISFLGDRYRVLRARLKEGAKSWALNSLVWLKTKPKEYGLYTLALSKQLLKWMVFPFRTFAQATWPKRLAYLVFLTMASVFVAVLLGNLRGIWLPLFYEPVLSSFADVAERKIQISADDPQESFYSAFPQQRHEFLFRKFKVNLHRTPENPLPMGAFELIVELDSKDTAIEVRDREIELFDLLQRVFEEENVKELATELGKSRVKSRLKRELNQHLTQGWAKDVNFKTFILKP